jgi:hypothetical protein
MFRAHVVIGVIGVVVLLAASLCAAQQSSEPSATTSCYLDDGRQVYVRYNPATTKTDRISNGKPFTPGGMPMTLFTEAQLSFGGTTIPVGAYTVYPIPEKAKWILAVNKNVSARAAYDEKQDVARTPMETDQLPESADTLEVAFAHVGSRCTLRIVFGKAATFADFVAK